MLNGDVVARLTGRDTTISVVRRNPCRQIGPIIQPVPLAELLLTAETSFMSSICKSAPTRMSGVSRVRTEIGNPKWPSLSEPSNCLLRLEPGVPPVVVDERSPGCAMRELQAYRNSAFARGSSEPVFEPRLISAVNGRKLPDHPAVGEPACIAKTRFSREAADSSLDRIKSARLVRNRLIISTVF